VRGKEKSSAKQKKGASSPQFEDQKEDGRKKGQGKCSFSISRRENSATEKKQKSVPWSANFIFLLLLGAEQAKADGRMDLDRSTTQTLFLVVVSSLE